MSTAPTFTYQTRINIDSQLASILDDYACLMSTVERKIFARLMAGQKATDLKNDFLKEFGITARQFNSCRVTIEGKIASIKQLRAKDISEVKDKIKRLKSGIKKSKKKSRKHNMNRRLTKLQNKLSKLKASQDKKVVSLCFGSKKLFRAQFHLEKTSYQSHQDWKKAWEEKRNNSFFLLGSKDETSGNQTCKATIATDGSLTLHIRLPRALEPKYGKYINIPNVYFKYGHDVILGSIQSSDNNAKKVYTAVCYRFVRDKKGWKAFASTTFKAPEIITNKLYGAVGVDINAGHLAVSETDRFGNIIDKFSVPVPTYGKSSHQAKAIIGDACKQVVDFAKKAKKPIVLEKLDFQRKKNSLRQEKSAKYARMLSSFSYNLITTFIKSRAIRCGVEVGEVNPAYTSFIGLVKFAQRYGLSTHHAAALCIARRFLGFSEQPPRPLEYVYDGKKEYIALSLPVRNRGQSLWSFWSRLRKKYLAAHAAHFRAINNRSSDPPKDGSCDRASRKLEGENLIRESLTVLLG